MNEHVNQVFLCTKFGIYGQWSTASPLIVRVCGQPEDLREYWEDSVELLGVQIIDLYEHHYIDHSLCKQTENRETKIQCILIKVNPFSLTEETVKALAELVKEEKLQYPSVSECTADELWRIYKVLVRLKEYWFLLLKIESDGVLDGAQGSVIAIVAW